MNISQVGDAEDWEIIKRAIFCMDATVAPTSVPKAKRGEVSRAKIPKVNRSLSKEKVSQAKTSKESHPSKKKKEQP